MYRNKKEWILATLVLISLLFSLFTIYVYSENSPSVSARAAALYEPETRSFVYTKNSNERLGMASTTKIMSALIALENIDLCKLVQIDDRAIGVDGSSIYLEKGEIMSAENLIYALMLNSANDAAEALAYEICGSIEGFCYMMNERAAALGLKDTHFSNPHGLDAKEHYTTAHDLALLTAEALKNPKFKDVASTRTKEITSNTKTRVLTNHNKLLRLYDGCIGVKTGYTQMTGRSLVGAAERDGLCLISVTLDAPNDWSDHSKMLDFGFNTVHSTQLIGEGEFNYSLPIIGGDRENISVTNKDALKYIYTSDTPDISKEIRLVRFATAPIKDGEVVGSIVFKYKGKIIAHTDIIATATVEKAKEDWLERLF
jgi:D-alanyl-D-alanine carboxypeptidase